MFREGINLQLILQVSQVHSIGGTHFFSLEKAFLQHSKNKNTKIKSLTYFKFTFVITEAWTFSLLRVVNEIPFTSFMQSNDKIFAYKMCTIRTIIILLRLYTCLPQSLAGKIDNFFESLDGNFDFINSGLSGDVTLFKQSVTHMCRWSSEDSSLQSALLVTYGQSRKCKTHFRRNTFDNWTVTPRCHPAPRHPSTPNSKTEKLPVYVIQLNMRTRVKNAKLPIILENSLQSSSSR